MTTGFAGLSTKKDELVHKALTGSVFIAPWATSAAITAATLFGATGDLINPLPAGYADLGFLTAAGAKFARTIKQTDIQSWQSLDPTRSDRISDTTTLVIEPQQTNQQTLAMYIGVAASALVPGANGAFELDRPDVTSPVYYRVLTLGVDETPQGEFVYARFFPKALVTAFNDQSFANGSDAITYGVTLTAYIDTALGYPESIMVGGAGHLAYLVDEGFGCSVTCSTTSASPTLTATTGNFYPSDVGAVVTGTGIPAATTILAYLTSTTVTLSANASATGSGVVIALAGKP